MQSYLYLRFMLLAVVVSVGMTLYAQSTRTMIEQAKALVDDKKYKEADRIYQNINESQISELGDSCLMLYNYGKGACLYFMDKYEEAIPFLQNGLRYMEKLPHEDSGRCGCRWFS